MNKTPPEVRAEIVQLYAGRHTVTTIARKVGRSQSTVLKVIREEGVYENGRRGTVPPEKTEAMVRMRADGMTYENIALQLGVSHMTVQNHLKARGEPATNVVRRRVERFDRDLARRLYAKGDPVVAIARRLDVSENSVYRAIKGAK